MSKRRTALAVALLTLFGSMAASTQPASASFTPSGQSEIGVGAGFVCSVDTHGIGNCWGNNSDGQLGDGTTTGHADPAPVTGGHVWSAISVGPTHACGVTTDGDGYCWGPNNSGQLGDGTTTPSSSPVLVTGGYHWRVIQAEDQRACGITTDDDGFCWGDNSNYQLGDGTNTARLVPTALFGSSKWSVLSPGTAHSCGVTLDGDAYCWGGNDQGQVGNGTTSYNVTTPTLVSGSLTWRSIDVATTSATCGVTTTNDGYCWGWGDSGQLGNASTSSVDVPTAVDGSHAWQDITIGRFVSCGVDTSGDGFCWGANDVSQVGDGTSNEADSPTALDTSAKFTKITAGWDAACGVSTDGGGYCWGASNALAGSDSQPELILVLGENKSSTVSAVIDPTLTFAVAAHTGSCNGVAQSAGSSVSSTSVSLGHINSSANGIAAQDLLVTTNAAGGFSVYARSLGAMNDGAGHTIADVSGSNATPDAFVGAGSAGFGYTTDATLSGVADRFSNPSVGWAALTSSNEEVAYAANGPTTNAGGCIAYQMGVASNTPAGSYSTTVIYTAVPVF